MITFLILIISIYFAGVLSCYLFSGENANKQMCWNPKKWISYVRGTTMKAIMPPHIVEQFMLRVHDERCKECVKEGYCTAKDEDGNLICGCKMAAKAYDPYEKCAAGRWGKMIMDKDEYERITEQYPVKINIEIENLEDGNSI